MRGFGVFVLVLMVFGVGAFLVFQMTGNVVNGESVTEIQEIEIDESESIHIIDIKNYAFIKSVTRIKSGESILWINRDPASHSVNSEDLFSSRILETGDSYSYTFEEPGRYSYNCGVHPYMKGTIVVVG